MWVAKKQTTASAQRQFVQTWEKKQPRGGEEKKAIPGKSQKKKKKPILNPEGELKMRGKKKKKKSGGKLGYGIRPSKETNIPSENTQRRRRRQKEQKNLPRNLQPSSNIGSRSFFQEAGSPEEIRGGGGGEGGDGLEKE